MISKEELMNRILLLEPDLTQALLELISDYETKMIKLEKQDKILKILNEYKEIIGKGIENLEEYKKYVYNSKNETEYFKTIGSLDTYKNVLSVLNEVLDNGK